MSETDHKQGIDIYELLAAIEARPVLYLASKSLSLLGAFLDGYFYASPQLVPGPKGLIDLHDWVALRLHYYESTSGYVNMILKTEEGNEEKSF